MCFKKSIFALAITISLVLGQLNTANSVEIVRLNLNYDNSAHTLDIELFDGVTPLTVATFLDYVDSGKYNGSFFTRSVQNFIIQTGGYTFRPSSPGNFLRPISEKTGLEIVPLEDSSPVENEYSLTTLTNIRGTVSMAKVAHNTAAASGEWFINLNDNRTNLDNQNGGFTVFGQIIDDGMILADEISSYPLHPSAGGALGSSFSDLPVVNYTFPDGILQENLIMISSAKRITRPVLRSTPDTKIPLDVAGDTVGTLQVLTVSNTGNEALTVSSINSPTAREFVIESETCSNATLNPASTSTDSCTLNVRFTANTESVISDSIGINYSSASLKHYLTSIELIAQGVPAASRISADKAIVSFSAVGQGAAIDKEITIINTGGSDLTIDTIATDNTDYSFDNADCSVGTVLALNQSCKLILTFTPTSVGDIKTNLNIGTSTENFSVELQGSGVAPAISTSISPITTLPFGQTIVGNTISRTITVSNSGSSDGLILSAFTITGSDADLYTYTTNCPTSFMVASQACSIFVRFTPTSSGTKTASLVIESNDPSNPQTIMDLTGNANLATSPLLLSADRINFTTNAGSSSSKTISVENIGTGVITINSITFTGTDSTLFNVDAADCIVGSTLGNCNLAVSFSPVLPGNFSASLFIQTTDGDLTIPLTGAGLIVEPLLSISAPAIKFGSQIADGSTLSQTLTLENNGSNIITISSISLSGTNQNLFSFDNADCNTGSTLNDCNLTISFTPLSAGDFTASAIIQTDHGTVNVALSGTGIATSPLLNASDNNVNFGNKLINGVAQNRTLTINNNGTGFITINSISITGTNKNLFTFDNASCTVGSILNSCDLTLSFTPSSKGNFSATLIIQTDAPNNNELTIPLSGTGIASTIIAPLEFNLGTSQINGVDSIKNLWIGNDGLSNLLITNISITGANSADFSMNSFCPVNTSGQIELGPQFQCRIEITLSSLISGTKTTDLILETNDPENLNYTIKLLGETDNDVDGVPSNIEQLAANNGDGNNDGIADEFQNNVATFLVNSNTGVESITMVSDTGLISKKVTLLTDVKVLDTLPAEFPKDKFFDLGAYGFTVRSELAGDVIDVGLFIPLGIAVDKFYRVGPTPDNNEPHLYDFTFNSETGIGARIYGQVTITTSSGEVISGNLVIIRFVDGGLGDDDLTANGQIVTGAGGLSTVRASDDSSGAMSANHLLLLLLLLMIRHENNKKTRLLNPD